MQYALNCIDFVEHRIDFVEISLSTASISLRRMQYAPTASISLRAMHYAATHWNATIDNTSGRIAHAHDEYQRPNRRKNQRYATIGNV